MAELPTIHQDPWVFLRRYTQARIALGHAGSSLPTKALLEFRLAHSMARDAVYHELDVERLQEDIRTLELPQCQIRSAAVERNRYLQRPDLGRQVHRDSLPVLQKVAQEASYDVVFMIGDGLSALAVEQHAAKLLLAVVPELLRRGKSVGPVVVAEQARVALGDEVGSTLAASLMVVLIGERPGLSSPDSLGVYLTWQPEPGKMDSERNCISNIRPEGLHIDRAARKLLFLIEQAFQRRVSGIELKDDSDDSPLLASSEGG